MNRLRETYRRIFPKKQPLPSGIYHYQTPPEATQQYRLHLRLEPDGSGILIVNAKTVLHLNQTAAEFAYYVVKQVPEGAAAREMARRYHVRRDQALTDFQTLRDQLDTLIHTPDLDPVTFLDFERRDPYTTELSAPYRLDCALTYQVSPSSQSIDAPMDRVRRELETAEWQTILDKAWAASIPHVVFTGGEPTLRPDLPELIAYAEKLGLVSGLLSDGLRLSETKYLQSLLQSGLDHLMVVIQPDEDQSWEALTDVMVADLFTTVHVTLTSANQETIPVLLKRLADLGVKSLSLSANDPALAESLKAARSTAANLNLALEWDLPVPYSALHPVALELAEGAAPAQGAGKAWLYVEPDGDVLPAQGVNQVMGNLLVDAWETIWKNRPQA
jgi:organic radical activating enzyme